MATASLPKLLPNADPNIEYSLQHFAARTAFTISSSREPDMPIIYVSQEFCKMTGYTEDEILGRNCRFLQGPGTSRQAVQELRNCIQEDRGCTVCLMNYTKDGKPFWNQLCLAPVHDEFGVSCYLGIQTNVTGEVLAYRSQQFSPFQTKAAGPHGGVHSFTCPEIVKMEIEAAQKLEKTIKRWHSEKITTLAARPSDFRPVSSKSLPSSLLAPLHKMHQSFVLADPNLPDTPIVHASEGFLRLTGRPRNEVVGHNCRFMQGPLTDRAEVQRLRDAMKEDRPITVRLLNYKNNGQLFWNHLHVAPIRNADGKVVFYVGCQLDITVKEMPPARRKSESSAPSVLSQHTVTVFDTPTTTHQAPRPQSVEEMTTIPETEVEEEAQTAQKEGSLELLKNMTLDQKSEQNNLLSVLKGSSQSTDSETVQHNSDQEMNGTSQEGNGIGQSTLAARQLPEALQLLSPASKQQQRSVIGTVRVVCRSLSTKTGLRRSLEDQHLPHGVNDCGASQRQSMEATSHVPGLRPDMPTLRSSHI